MVKQRVPQVCIYCDNFPCIKGDSKFSVISEIENSYPFLNEEDKFKPCDGKKFVPVNFVIEEEQEPMGGVDIPVSAPAGTQVILQTVPPETYNAVRVIRTADALEMEVKLNRIAEDNDVVDFEIKGFASVYDSASSQTRLVAIVLVKLKKTAGNDLQDIKI